MSADGKSPKFLGGSYEKVGFTIKSEKKPGRMWRIDSIYNIKQKKEQGTFK